MRILQLIAQHMRSSICTVCCDTEWMYIEKDLTDKSIAGKSPMLRFLSDARDRIWSKV